MKTEHLIGVVTEIFSRKIILIFKGIVAIYILYSFKHHSLEDKQNKKDSKQQNYSSEKNRTYQFEE